MTEKNKKQTKKKTPAVKPIAAEQTKDLKKAPVYDEKAVDAFIMEVDEEVKNDNLKDFFKKYGVYVVVILVLVLSLTVSFETIKNWRENNLKAKTDAYIAANFEQAFDTKLAALEKIASGKNGIYSELARIQIADLLFEQGKNEDALNMLNAIVNNDELNSRIRNLAAIKLASYKLDTAPRSEIEALLAPVVAADDSWAPIAQEYMALAAVQDGDLETARNIYQNLLQDSRTSDEFKSRIQDMLTTISDI